jgi:uncharacterized protein
MTAPTGPLSDKEFDELDEFLMSDALPEETMDIAMLDGFLTALVIGPNLIEPGRWLPEIWGGRQASEDVPWQSADQQARITNMILRHWNFLLAQFQGEPEAYEPVLYASEEDGREVSIIDEWCIGFVRGMNLDGEAWQPIMDDDEIEEFLWPIMLYGTEAGWQEIEQNPGLAAKHDDFAEALPDCVLAIHDFWAPERAGRTTVRMEAPKVGRNDLCPCGSGRKFKKCCGAPGKLN